MTIACQVESSDSDAKTKQKKTHVTLHQTLHTPPFNQIMCPGAKHIHKHINIRKNTDSLKDTENIHSTHQCTLISVRQGRIGSDTEISP